MNENAKAWVKELETTALRQGKNILHNQNGLCCLGLACELYAREHPDFKVIKHNTSNNDTGRYEVAYGRSGSLFVLPDEVQKWLGLLDGTGAYDIEGEYVKSLSGHNDEGKTFKEIAGIIMENEGLLF